MKKIMAVLIFSFLTLQAKEVRRSIKGGVSVPTMIGGAEGIYVESTEGEYLFGLDKGANPGLNVAASLEYNLKPRFSILWEAHFCQSGVSYNGEMGPLKADTTQTLNYLRVPILFSLNFPLKNNRLSLYSGPTASFLLSARENSSLMAEKDRKTTGSYHRWNTGMTTGIGFDIPAGKGRVTFDIRHHIGFITTESFDRYNISINGSSPDSDEIDQRDMGLAFLIGYMFPKH